MIKYGCIRSAELFALLEQASAKDRIHEIIYACVDMKRVVVEHDEKEAGERALLNFGHTAGHAIEKLWNYQTVTHGAAVGIGMVLAARAGEGAGLTEPGTADRIAALLQNTICLWRIPILWMKLWTRCRRIKSAPQTV